METKQTKTKKTIITFTTDKNSIIVNSPMFSTLKIKKIENNIYSIEIEISYVDTVKEQIQRNGGKILRIKSS